MADHGAGRAIPTHTQLERAISSVTGVISAEVSQDEPGERSRLRIRIAPGEDAEAVSWAVAATLRERFGIPLDPDEIRPRPIEQPSGDPSSDPVHLVDDLEPPADAGREGDGGPEPVGRDVGAELSESRDRLTSAAQEALDGLHSRFGGGRRGTDTRRQAPGGATASDALFNGSVASVSSPEEPDVAASVPEPEARGSLSMATPEGGMQMPETTVSDQAPSATEPGSPGPRRSGPGAAPPPPEPRATSPAADRGDRADAEILRRRPAIRHLDTQRDPRDVRVTATLEHAGRSADGQAISVPTGQGVLRAVAEATVDALRRLAGPNLLVGVDRVTVHPANDPATATVVVTMLTERGEETLLGASIVRGDPERAVMRATLDALNRRVASLLEPA